MGSKLRASGCCDWLFNFLLGTAATPRPLWREFHRFLTFPSLHGSATGPASRRRLMPLHIDCTWKRCAPRRRILMKTRTPQHTSLAVPALAGLTLLVFASAAMAGSSSKHRFSGWKPAEPVMEVNDNMAMEGCPIESRDGLSLFIASNRPSEQTQDDGVPRNDIWVSDRVSKDAPFGSPEN